MARIVQAGRPVLNITHGNFLLAHIQTAAYQRFRQGEGFFITFFGGTGDGGEPMPANSLWCPAHEPLHFLYDPFEEPIDIQQDLVEMLLSAMNDPIGVIVAPNTQSDITWPFTVLSSGRPSRQGDLRTEEPQSEE